MNKVIIYLHILAQRGLFVRAGKFIYPFMAVLLLISCSNESNTSDIIYFEGEINRANTLSITQKITKDTKVLRIKSLGGELASALDLAEVIQKNKIEVEAVGVCMSACLVPIWISGTKRHVAPKTLLIYHRSSVPVLYLQNQIKNRDIQYFLGREFLANDNFTREITIFENAGIDDMFALDLYAARGFRCFEMRDKEFDVSKTSLIFEWDGVILTEEFLKIHGVVLSSGSLDDRPDEVENLYYSIFRNVRRPRLTIARRSDFQGGRWLRPNKISDDIKPCIGTILNSSESYPVGTK